MSCSDGNCFFRDRSKPLGQVTNGGCHCLDDVDGATRIKLRQLKHKLSAENATLKQQLEVAVEALEYYTHPLTCDEVPETDCDMAIKAIAKIKTLKETT